jgi:hypothetical protein
MTMQKEGLDEMFPFLKNSSFLEKFVPSGIFLTSCHLLILDGHGSHVIQKK